MDKNYNVKVNTVYYDGDELINKNCLYSLVVGERSNGKTYFFLKHCLKEYWKSGKQFAYIRRWEEDIKGKRGSNLFSALINNGEISNITNGEFETIVCYSGQYWLANYDEDLDKYIKQPQPFCYSFAISSNQHDKSSSYPNIKNIIFDEFLTSQRYLQNEFSEYCNLLSTIIRDNSDVRIFMLANTVNFRAPYFVEYGIDATKLKKGSITLYKYGQNEETTLAIEYCDTFKTSKGKPSDIYFAFDNPQLKMITHGEWTLEIFPHCPIKYKDKDIKFIYFIKYVNSIYQCEIVQKDNIEFTFIHKKSTPIKDEKKDIIFQVEYSPQYNIRRNILRPYDKIGELIAYYFKCDKVFYQDNFVGQDIQNFLNEVR